MPNPDLKEFLQLAGEYSLVPIAKSVAADLQTPVSAFLSIARDEPHAFLLESIEGGEKIGRYTFLGVRPYMILSARGQQVTIEKGRNREHRTGSPFAVLREVLQEHRPAQVGGLPPFTAGAVGFFAYDAVRHLENLPKRARTSPGVPDCALMFFDRLLAFDHLRHQIHIIAAADVRARSPRKAYERALRDIDALEKKLAASVPLRDRMARGRSRAAAPKPRPVTSRSRFLRDVQRVKEYIAAGDIFQAVLSQRFDLKLDVPAFQVYRALRAINPSPYMYFLRFGDSYVLGSSPEMLVKAAGDHLEYRPIAGTVPRGANETEDRRLEQKLRNDEKERAEHVMLVDLGRNDLGRVSEYGSVRVRDLMYVERYSHVMHLVSAIEGKLRAGLHPVDAFAACFPAGTLTGAPKVRAMEIIEELEPVRRGVYGGSVLYADFAGNLDSCIAIRTMVAHGKQASVQAGAGIVADSDAQREYEECVNKARALLRAVELAQG